ncbi:MAG: cysteine hydrolase family protein [Pseudoclavibacter sp.]
MKTYPAWTNGEFSDPVDLPSEHTALIVVDMQNAFLKEEFSLGLAASQAPFATAIPGTAKLIEAARAANILVIYSRFAFLPGNVDQQRPFGRAKDEPFRPLLVDGTPDIEIIDELAPQPGDIVIDKSRPSVFHSTRLEGILTANGIRNVVLCGVTTNVCVETTARDASQRDYNTYVVEDATGEGELSRHWHALYTIEFTFGTVCTVADAQRSWGVEVTGVPGYPLSRGQLESDYSFTQPDPR